MILENIYTNTLIFLQENSKQQKRNGIKTQDLMFLGIPWPVQWLVLSTLTQVTQVPSLSGS